MIPMYLPEVHRPVSLYDAVNNYRTVRVFCFLLTRVSGVADFVFFLLLRVPEDEFLILATDGVWDVMDNPGIVSFLQKEVGKRHRVEGPKCFKSGEGGEGERGIKPPVNPLCFGPKMSRMFDLSSFQSLRREPNVRSVFDWSPFLPHNYSRKNHGQSR